MDWKVLLGGAIGFFGGYLIIKLVLWWIKFIRFIFSCEKPEEKL